MPVDLEGHDAEEDKDSEEDCDRDEASQPAAFRGLNFHGFPSGGDRTTVQFIYYGYIATGDYRQ